MNAIDIPAIRGSLGKLTYYTATFTFQQIAERVKIAEDELHTSNSLREQLQRTLTDNYISIKNYILTQKEHFFNALVLAIYDGDPTWNELEFEYNNNRYNSMGFLHLNGEERIFPVDGQHRVEGIKSALKENPKLKDETITVIFIGHHNTKEGKEKTRRIFSTLNRYAKPVKLGDIIALDEDDTVAIVTRNLLESYPLFMNDNIKADLKGSKALSDNDTKSFTSLLTLYDTNRIIYTFYKSRSNSQRKFYGPSKISEFLKFRPEQKELDNFENYLRHFWDLFCKIFPEMETYLIASADQAAASRFRNKNDGGLLYFRPVALPKLVKAICETCFNKNVSLESCMQGYSNIEMVISNYPWDGILWNSRKHTMIMSNKAIISSMLMFIYDESIFKARELANFKKSYSKALEISIDQIDEKLDLLRNAKRL